MVLNFRRTAVAVLTHDPKFDVPLLVLALRDADVGYVGAMGSRRTHDLREGRLREHGLGDAELASLRSPIGLDLGARTPQETVQTPRAVHRSASPARRSCSRGLRPPEEVRTRVCTS